MLLRRRRAGSTFYINKKQKMKYWLMKTAFCIFFIIHIMLRGFKLKCRRMLPWPWAAFTFFKLDSSRLFLRFLEDPDPDAEPECGLVLHTHSKPREHVSHAAPRSEAALSLHRRWHTQQVKLLSSPSSFSPNMSTGLISSACVLLASRLAICMRA